MIRNGMSLELKVEGASNKTPRVDKPIVLPCGTHEQTPQKLAIPVTPKSYSTTHSTDTGF